MPHINPITGAIAGYRRDWFDETRTVEQECNTLQPGCVVALSDGTIVYPAPSNEVRGGGEVWALLTLDLVVLTSTGLTLPGAGLPDLGAMSWDGAVPIKDVRNSYGPWHVHERDGSQWLLSNGDAYDIQLLGSQLAIWRESPSSALHQTPGLNLTPPPIGEGGWGWPRSVNVDGRWRLLYCSYAPLCLVLDGHIVAENQLAYYPDVAYVNGTIIVTWALDQADADIRSRTFTPAELATFPVFPPPTPPDPEPPDPPPTTAPPAVTITSYTPTSGPAPLTVTAVYAVEDGSGPITELHWQYRTQGATSWTDDAVTPPSDSDNAYMFVDVGTYELRLLAIGPGGEGATGAQRLVTVTGDTPIPPTPIPPPEDKTMAVYLKLGHYYTGVEPTPIPDESGDACFPVYADRDEGGAWEEVELTPHDDGTYDARYVAANRVLSIQPDGTLETRDATTFGGYEALFATTQPDGASILYRRDEDIVIPCNILTIEDRS